MEEQEPFIADVKIDMNVDYENIYIAKKRKWWQFWKKKETPIILDSEPSNIRVVSVPEKRMTEEKRKEKFIIAILDWINKRPPNE